ncbi:hypothetical protein HZC33_02530 [Candidatus Wolfebacteria bacterium]|nr:hypothetical protein [Candidatus Wolfebacteria bacterium]
MKIGIGKNSPSVGNIKRRVFEIIMATITSIGENTLSAKLKTILPNCDRIDALVGYFYFSGFRDLHNELKDKTIRILVGMDIDKKIIEKISSFDDLNLDDHAVCQAQELPRTPPKPQSEHKATPNCGFCPKYIQTSSNTHRQLGNLIK